MKFFSRYWPVLPLVGIPFLYVPALINLWGRWMHETEFSHGVLIPLISLYIIFDRREEILRSVDKGSARGIWLIAFALILLLLGEVSALFVAKQTSFVILLLGLVYAYLGKGAGRLLTAPILILLFAIPVPYFIEAILTARLQLLSSELGVIFIRWMDIPVFLSGNIIDLGRVQLEVAEACSGLRFLYPLMSIGFILAYFYQTHIAKRLIIFLSTIPITILMNSLRIALTAVLVERYGQAAVEGLAHDAEGWLTFGGCLLLLFSEILILERLTSRRSLVEIIGITRPSATGDGGRLKLDTLPVYASLIFLLLAGAGLHGLSRIQQTDLPETNLALFPNQLGAWRGQSSALDSNIAQKLLFTDHLMVNFHRPDLIEPVNLYVAFYASQRNGESPHSPRVCIPGGGWKIENFERVELDRMPVNRVIISRDGQKQLVYYWFAERGMVVADEYEKKWLLLRDFLRTGRSDGALVRVSIPIIDAEKIDQTERIATEFIALAQPVITQYLPAASI